MSEINELKTAEKTRHLIEKSFREYFGDDDWQNELRDFEHGESAWYNIIHSLIWDLVRDIQIIQNKIKKGIKTADESMEKYSKVGTEYPYWNGEFNALKRLKTWIKENIDE